MKVICDRRDIRSGFGSLEKNSDTLKLDDDEVVARVLGGNVQAFETLLNRHSDLVMRIVKRHVPFQDAEEVAQDAFVRVYESLPSFKGKSVFPRWLSSIAVRTCYDYWRRAYRRREVVMTELTERHQEWLEGVISEKSEEDRRESDSRGEAQDLLNWALARMTPESRMILEMIHLEGLSVKEVSDLLGWSTANVKVRSFRARKKMEKLLIGQMRGKRRMA